MRRSTRYLLLGVLTLPVAGPCAPLGADDPPPKSAPAASKPAPPTPPTVAQAAEAVRLAAQQGDATALGRLAALEVPDPWLVADELLRRAEPAAAAAFAAVATRPDVASLTAYVAGRPLPADDETRRHRLARWAATPKASDHAALEALLAERDPAAPSDVVGIRVALHEAAALLELTRLAEARTAYLRAAAAAEGLGWLVQATFALHHAGASAIRHGDYAAARVDFERRLALELLRGDAATAAKVTGNLAIVYGRLGEHAKALELHERSLADKLARGDLQSAATTLSNIANVQHQMGDYAKALATHKRALEQKETLGDRAGVALVLGNMGNVYRAMGDYALALDAHERAHALKVELGDRPGAATTLGNLGNLYTAIGEHARALTTLERALAEKEALGDRVGVAATWGNIGNVRRALGDLEGSIEAHERALTGKQALGDEAGAALTLGNLGSVLCARGNCAVGLETLERAMAANERLGDRARAAQILSQIGVVQHKRGDLKGARKSLEDARRRARSLRDVPTLVRALSNLAEVHLDAGDTAQALAAAQQALREVETLFGGLGEEEGAMARQTQGSLFAVGALAAFREGDTAATLEFLESGRAGALLDALDKRETLRLKAESLPAELRAADAAASAAERDARLAYQRALEGTDRPARAAANRALDQALEEVRAVNARIQRATKSAAQLFYPRARSLEDIQAALDPGEALVVYGLCLQEALALVVRPDGVTQVSLGERAPIEDACAALELRKPLGDPGPALADLRRRLIEPLTLGADVTQVLVSPEGPLCFLPWGPLLDRPVCVTPSGSTHCLLRDDGCCPGEGVLALGDPDYGGVSEGAQAIYYRGRKLSPLPATRAEAQSVATRVLLGPEASEDGLRAALATQPRWRAVHLACHGLIDAERPSLSSLALTRAGDGDGFLTALEVLRMQVPADLAVLSACETATGRLVGGEGIVGLTRAFMYAGTPRVLCSLWKVDDEATAALMTRFYEIWHPPSGAPGPSASAALQQAQAHVRAQERWQHPSYWAAWVLWGLP